MKYVVLPAEGYSKYGFAVREVEKVTAQFVFLVQEYRCGKRHSLTDVVGWFATKEAADEAVTQAHSLYNDPLVGLVDERDRVLSEVSKCKADWRNHIAAKGVKNVQTT